MHRWGETRERVGLIQNSSAGRVCGFPPENPRTRTSTRDATNGLDLTF